MAKICFKLFKNVMRRKWCMYIDSWYCLIVCGNKRYVNYLNSYSSFPLAFVLNLERVVLLERRSESIFYCSLLFGNNLFSLLMKLKRVFPFWWNLFFPWDYFFFLFPLCERVISCEILLFSVLEITFLICEYFLFLFFLCQYWRW